MSQNDSIKQLLNIQDPNIQILHVKKETMKNQDCQIISAILSYCAPDCANCLKKMVKNGFTSSDILLLPTAAFKSILRLRKQRFRCQSCGKSKLARTQLVKENHQISKAVQFKIFDLLLRKRSMTEIAFDLGISVPTVARRLNRFNFKRPSSLPESLSFDEFKAFGSQMAFHLLNPDTHQTLDILPSRRLKDLEEYFSHYSRQERGKVKRIVIDMYAPYYSLIKKCFPKAEIIIDRFHIYQHLNRAFTQTRIASMKDFKRSTKEYKHIKRYWKLLNMNKYRLDLCNYRYQPSFKTWISEKEIVQRLLAYDAQLKRYYTLYQEAMHLLDRKASQSFFQLIDQEVKSKSLNAPFETSFRTFKKIRPYIENSLKFKESNGPIEGMNNQIKVLKRIAFGYRNFHNFRNRIFLVLQQSHIIQHNNAVLESFKH